jgi:tetratricopeptide (TPR) repeat protein
MAVAQITEAMYGSDVFITSAEASAREASRLNSNLWLPHVVMGAIHCCRYQWDEAKIEFDVALKQAPLEVRYHPLYLAFLIATGGTNRALQFAKSRVNENPQDAAASTIYGLCLYITRAYDEAAVNLGEAFVFDSNYWPPYVIFCCVSLRKPADMDHPSRTGSHDSFLDRRRCYELFPGLDILSMRWNVDDRAGQKYQELQKQSEERYASPWELALAHMAYGENDRAIEALERAIAEHHPFTVWLHLWPILDSLREYEAFRALIRRMNLPLNDSPSLP